VSSTTQSRWTGPGSLAVTGVTALALSLVVLDGVRAGFAQTPPPPARRQPLNQPPAPLTNDSEITTRIKPILDRSGVPSIIAALVDERGLNRIGAVGVRKKGSNIPIDLSDLWRIGGCTKAFTAALAGRAVERRQLRWVSTVAEVFPELAAGFHPDSRAITLRQLLTHYSGLKDALDWNQLSSTGGTLQQQRLQAVRVGLSEKPALTPGSQWQYSTLGYVIAGAMIERAQSQPWEQGIRSEIFAPLQMNDSGFGVTGSGEKLDQPWGHDEQGNPISPRDSAGDVPPLLGPSARIHCSLQDWARFIADQMPGGRGLKGLLLPETYRILHKPYADVDAMGWSAHPLAKAGEYYLAFDGSDRGNYALVFAYPFTGRAIVICINQGGDLATNTAHEVLKVLADLPLRAEHADPV
jgi:D-alanyl-D-alanine carboxypeptidase